jgi:FdhD protein
MAATGSDSAKRTRSAASARRGTAGPRTPTGARAVPLPGGGHDLVVIEEPLFLDIAGTRLLTMRTPMGEAADLDWALGFLASEGVIEDISEIRELAFTQGDPAAQTADEVRVGLWRPSATDRLGSLTRTHEMRASCGLCGVASAESLAKGIRPLPTARPAITPVQTASLIAQLRVAQPLFAATGGCHGAGIAAPTGAFHAVAEDIGRHNALDRALGACLRLGVRPADSVAVLSGRAGYELVVKCLRVGVPVIVSVGAASSFAVDLARAANATLIGFVRGDDSADDRPTMRIYSDPGRLSP